METEKSIVVLYRITNR